jgi:uncharacterized protein
MPSNCRSAPFTLSTGIEKVRLAEDGSDIRDPARVAVAYSEDSRWRNRSEFFQGRAAIVEFLTRKWASEHDYRLIRELGAFHENRIAVRFQ